MAEPRLSVIMVAGQARERAARCLASILAQDPIDSMEVLILDCVAKGVPPLEGADHASVQVVPQPPETLYASARAEGVRLARAPIVAFIEEHALALPGWAEAILRAFEGPWAGVGPEMHNANPGVGISDAVSLFYYGAWLAPASRRISEFLAGHNSSYRRDRLLNFGARLDSLLRTEPILQWELKRLGHRLLVDPSVRVAHAQEATIRDFAFASFVWHRCFGYTRAQAFRWSLPKRAAYVALSPLIPLARTGKLLVLLLRDRRDLLGRFVRGLPVILIGHVVSATGMALGVLLGMGEAERHFAEVEHSTHRGESVETETGGSPA